MEWFGNLFGKKVLVYQKRNKQTWKQIREVLKEAGIKGVSASHTDQDTVFTGPGAPIDPRMFSGKKAPDREIYQIRVPVEEEGRPEPPSAPLA